jgi:hypothetical protein
MPGKSVELAVRGYVYDDRYRPMNFGVLDDDVPI